MLGENDGTLSYSEGHIFFKPEEMQGADAGFFCGTAAEIVALDSLDKIPFKLNWEDSLAFKIQTAYRHLVLEEDYSYLKSENLILE